MSGRFDPEDLEDIFEKTDGHCRYCGKQLAWSNYGRVGERAAWEVDHSIPISRDGTDHFSNLWPACVSCNTEKGTLTGSEFLQYLSGARSRHPSSDLGEVWVLEGRFHSTS
jgi:CRISPR/Cas system Type II protein with McrA/HNH and RuvC-like nuclease domain